MRSQKRWMDFDEAILQNVHVDKWLIFDWEWAEIADWKNQKSGNAME